MPASDQPGCWGTAARLPKKPGTQKLSPPSSAIAAPDGAPSPKPKRPPQARASFGCVLSPFLIVSFPPQPTAPTPQGAALCSDNMYNYGNSVATCEIRTVRQKSHSLSSVAL